MMHDNLPKKIIIFYDKVTDTFLIRLVNSYYEDLIKYDFLPAMCRLSELYVDVIDVTSADVTCIGEVRINNKFMFKILNVNNDVEISNIDGKSTSNVTDVNLFLKELFNIEI